MAGEDGDKLLAFAEKVLGLWATPVGKTPDEQIFDSAALKGIYDIKAFKQGITCLLKVEKRHCNFMGNMHGGCIATIVDDVGSAAMSTITEKPHVSLSITTNYLRAVPFGSIVRITGKVLKPGSSVVTTNVELADEATGKLLAQGTHIKYISDFETKFHLDGSEAPQTARL